MATRTSGRGSLRTQLEPLQLSGLAPVSTALRSSPGDRPTRTPLTALLDGDTGIVSPSSWLRTPPVPTPRGLDFSARHASLSKLGPPGTSPRIPLPTQSGNAFGDSARKQAGGFGVGDGNKWYNTGLRGSDALTLSGKPPSGLVGMQSLATQQKRQQQQMAKLLRREQTNARREDLKDVKVERQEASQPGTQLNAVVQGQHAQFQQSSLQHQGHTLQPNAAPPAWAPNAMIAPHMIPPGLTHTRPLVPAMISPTPGAAPVLFGGKDVVAKRILPLDKSQAPPAGNAMMNGAGSKPKPDANSTQIARAIRNREAASKSRLAAKMKVKRLEDENKLLKARVAVLENDSRDLRRKYGLPPLKEPEYQFDMDDGNTANGLSLPAKRARRK